MEAPPKKKMTSARAKLMFGVALLLSIFIFIFSTLPVSAPIMIGVVAGAVVTQKTGSSTLGEITAWFSGFSTIAAEILSGVGAAAIGTVGEIAADSLDVLALGLIFPLWYMLSGIKQFGGKHALNRFFIGITSFIIGLIPILNIIPSVLIGVSLVILSVKKEDAENMLLYEKKMRKQNAINKPYGRQINMREIRQPRAIHDSTAAFG